MTARRAAARAVAVVVVLLVTVACGDDDLGEQPSTVPPTTAASTDAAAGGDDIDPSSTRDTEPAGDLTSVSIDVRVLVELEQPIDTAVAPNGEWWIAQRTGQVVVVDPDTGEVGDTVLDISSETVADGERGLLGMAVDDDHLYLNFTDTDGDTHVDAWSLVPGSGRPQSRTPLLFLAQPFSNHNGGGLAIGPDGHLYVGVGDGGFRNDPLGSGQDPTTLLGSILRIDPTPDVEDQPYAVPADNPFADGVDGQPEIFLIGTRNPWRISFDAGTDDLWVADVGQDLVEELDLLPGAEGWGLGSNLGWNLREGTTESTGPRPAGNVDPVYEYRHDGDPDGCSVSGGHVYRGAAIPELVGSYVFGDFCSAEIWAVSTAGGETTFRDLGVAVPGEELVGFGVDPDGELVTLSLNGPVAQIVAG